jgi:hypothetical protein
LSQPLNLINNARRFTDRGSITVQDAVEAEYVRVTVADTGIGISPSEHESMFKEFHQLDSPPFGARMAAGWGWRSASGSSRCMAGARFKSHPRFKLLHWTCQNSIEGL